MNTPAAPASARSRASLRRFASFAALGALLVVASLRADTPPLTISQNHFQTSDGAPVRFWGINLVAMYPTHAESDGIAANLASREINLVRQHHNLRSSLDWNTVSAIPALVTYVNNTRTPHTEAWDRFDYLNAQLRNRGIYVLLSLHSSRRFLAGDVDIMTTDATDRTNWMNAMSALNSMSGNLDLFKMLPVIDERCARLTEEFAQMLITHVNPYTGRAYGSDSQVLYIETMNEHSCEYAIVAGNKFQSTSYPAVSYFSTQLQAKWDAYTAANSITPCDIYAPSTTAQKLARGDFLRGLDQAYANRMKNFVRNLGCAAPMAFSNLWRGEAFQKLEESLSDVIEEHNYADPLIPRTFDDAFNYFTRSTPVGKPYFVGELNQGTTDSTIATNVPYRATMQLAASAYGAFNDWSGVTWFAWAHGDKMIGNDGWSIWEERRPAVNSDMIGQLESDGVMLDHLRTTGVLFKRGLVAPSAQPKTLYADDPLGTSGYTSLIAPKYQFQAGWQNISAIKRAFGPVPASQPTANWMTTAPTNPLVSDTNEIRKDTARQQLTVSATQAEAFSGKLDAQAPSGLAHLGLGANSGWATVILVATDNAPLATSANLLVSRTYFDTAGNEIANPTTTIAGVQTPSGNNAWHIKRTRPRGETGYEALTMSGGVLALPSDAWHEAELIYAPIGRLPVRQSSAQPGDVLRPVIDDTYRLAGVFATTSGGFTRNAQGVFDPSTVLVPPEGAKSLRMKFTAGFDPCVLGWNFTKSNGQATTLDLAAFKNTHGLRFWVYTKRVVSSFAVELACDNGTQLVEVRLPLSRYLAPGDYGNKWVEVTVPFADFPATNAAGTPFLWNQVKGVGFYCSTVTDGYYDPYVDNVRLVRTAIAPATPTGVIAAAENAQVVLTWSPVSDATSYNVKRATSVNAIYTTIASATTNGFTDATVTNGTTYYYTVSAVNSAGEGLPSAPVGVTPQPPPTITSNLSASGTYAFPFSYAITTSRPATQFAATGLPAGLAIDSGTGVIFGTPAVAGNFSVTLSATNAFGTGIATLVLGIAKAPATIALGNLSSTYDGSAKSASATTDPAGLAVNVTYDGSPTPPINAGSYAVVATINDAHYAGTASGTLVIVKAPAAITLGQLAQTYDGAPKNVSVVTTPAGLGVSITYNGSTSAPTNAGAYAIAAAISDTNYFGSTVGTLTIAKASAAIALEKLRQSYDGAPKTISVTTTPANLAVDFTYDGGVAAPIYPGPHAVAATINDANYTGSTSGTLVITVTALLRHAPTLDGEIDGAAQIALPEDVTLNNGAMIALDLLVPGTPSLLRNGSVTFVGTIDGAGSATPTSHIITLNNGAVLRYLVRRIDAIALPVVAAPSPTAGTRSVVLNGSNRDPGEFATLRDLTLDSGAGTIAVPPGAYGDFVASNNSAFLLGIAGACEPAVYELQNLTLNHGSSLQLAGPVILRLANDMSLSASVGDAAHPTWLTLQIYSGGVTLNSRVSVHGTIVAPNGTVVLSRNATVRGEIAADSLVLSRGALIVAP